MYTVMGDAMSNVGFGCYRSDFALPVCYKYVKSYLHCQLIQNFIRHNEATELQEQGSKDRGDQTTV